MNNPSISSNLQKIPFNITTSGPKNTRVPIGAVLSAGNYFMNVEITSGSGILYRAIDGAVYPYNVSNLISITGTNFIGDLDRYYYFFILSLIFMGFYWKAFLSLASKDNANGVKSRH